jgi:hypothetical protein
MRMQDDNSKYYATMCGFWFNPDKVEITKPFVKEIKIEKEPELIDWSKYRMEPVHIDEIIKTFNKCKTEGKKFPQGGIAHEKEHKSSLDIATEMVKEKTNTQEHYKGKDSLYKFAEEWKLNTYEFDILKRIVRCRHKGSFTEDLNKTIDLIKIYKKEQKDLHG